MTLFTLGHSTRTLEELIGLIREHRIEVLADIRSFPLSRRHPHFNRENLALRLAEAGVEYRWLGKELGGYRKRIDPNSPHTALRSPGFRNYADHTRSAEFADGIDALLKLAEQKRVAIMCAEKLWWRCHRSLVSDYLAGCSSVEVIHIIEPGRAESHRLHRAARLVEGKLVYDVEEQARLL